jgi:hypothetical protein
MLNRRNLTKAVIDQVAVGGKPVGDGVVPKNAGWIGGQPNKEGTNFVPFSVVSAGTSSSSSGPINDDEADWQVIYAVSSFGVAREQVEWMADTARENLALLRGSTIDLGGTNYKIILVRVDAIGGIQRVDATEPQYWGQTDSYTVWAIKTAT